MKLRARGIRFRTLLLVALCAIPYLIHALIATEERRRDELQQARDQIRTLARLITAEHAQNLAHARQLLAVMALSVHRAHPFLGPACGQHLSRLFALHPGYRQLVIARPDGNVVCTAKPLSGRINVSDRGYFRDALQHKSFAQSSVINGRLGGGNVIVVAQALLDRSSKVLGVAIATLDLDWIKDRLEGAALPPSSGAAIVDARGAILRPFPNHWAVDARLTDADEFARRAAANDEGYMEGVGPDGVRRVLAYARFSNTGAEPLYVRVGFPQSAIDAAALPTLRNGLVAAAIVISITLLGGWLAASLLVVRPIRRLITAAGRLGEGDLAARTGLPHTADAIGQLAAKLDALASHAHRTTRALTALSAGNRTILRERDEGQLLRAMCDVLVRHAGYPFAVVNYARRDDAKSIERMAAAGDDHGLLAAAGISWADDVSGPSTVGTAIRLAERSVIKSVRTDPRAAPWRTELEQRGYQSIVSLPLRAEDEVVGALTLMAAEEDAFDDAELELLDEMAADLSFGIDVIRSRRRREEAEQRAERAATHDALTGLPNASFFLNRACKELAHSRSAGEPMTVLVVHLRRLQDLYDSLGFDPGNAVVRAIASRLGGLRLRADELARTGVDDFAILLPASDAARTSTAVRAISDALHQPLAAASVQVEMQPAIGASFYPGHGDDAALLLRRAGIAAREAARKGLDYLAYKGATERENPARLQIAAELRGAIDKRALHLEYQPKLDAQSGAIVGCEALVRWTHPVKGALSPAQFIPVAEQTGLIRQLTDLVLELAVRDQRAWAEQGVCIPTAVNLSARSLYDARLLDRVDGLLNTWGVSPRQLEFEITESALMEEPEVAKSLVAGLGSRGSRIYIDDFGTGYSSLSYLVTLPVHALKIDRAFVVQMIQSKQAHSMVAGMISLAHSLQLKVVAEGVETQAELVLLREMGCDQIQGYHTGRPVPARALLDLVRQARNSSR